MLDNFTPFDSLNLHSVSTPKSFSAESFSTSYSAPSSYVLRGKSAYAVGASGFNPLEWSKKCNTALATEIRVEGEDNARLSRVDTSLMADGTKLYTLVVPKGAQLRIQGIPLDTGAKDGKFDFGWKSVTKWAKDGFSQDYHVANEKKESLTGVGGVDVYRQYYNYPNLALLSVAESKRQHPEWYDNDGVTPEQFADNLENIYDDIGMQMLNIAENNPYTLQTLQGKSNIFTADGSDYTLQDNNIKTFNKEGSYLITLRYGYDANSSKENDWYAGKAGFWNYAVRGILEIGSIVLGGWIAQGLTKAAMGLRGAYLSGRSLTGMARLAGATTVRLGPTATSGLIQTSLLGTELLAWSSPWLSPMFTGAKLSNNDCDFPASGHVHNFEIKVYDPAKTDAYGNPTCPKGTQRPLVETTPPRLADIPCCPEGSVYEPNTGFCKKADGSAADPSISEGQSGESVRWLVDNSESSPQLTVKALAAVGLGLVFLTRWLRRK
jgi:hypothetical protein